MKNKSIFQNILVWFGAVQLQQLIDIFAQSDGTEPKRKNMAVQTCGNLERD